MNAVETCFVTGNSLPPALEGAGQCQLISFEALAKMVAPLFGFRTPPVAVASEEGALTRVIRWDGRDRLVTFNDTSHLNRRPATIAAALAEGLPVVALIRHGRTAANLAGRWQGSMDDPLDEVGERQASALFEWYGSVESVWTSPLRRAAATASALHAGPNLHADLVELNFGNWEGMTTEEIRATGPLFDQIFVDGSDHPRGETGETWALLERRMTKALDEIQPEPGKITGIVTHGAAIRAVISSLTGSGWAGANGLFTPPNTSVTHLVMSDPPVVADYALAPHLDGLGT